MRKVSYEDIIQDIEFGGILSFPRNQTTFELLNATLQFPPITKINRSKMNESLANLEVAMFISGTFRMDLIKLVAPNADHSLYEFQSDYGPRTFDQFSIAQQLLRDDPDTRRAIVNFNDRHQESHDISCTNSIQFINRSDTLFTTVNMRSWDAVYGLPMDIRMFGAVSLLMSASLGLKPGLVTVNAGSLHIYQATRHKATEVKPPELINLKNISGYIDMDWHQISNNFLVSIIQNDLDLSSKFESHGNDLLDSKLFNFTYDVYSTSIAQHSTQIKSFGL